METWEFHDILLFSLAKMARDDRTGKAARLQLIVWIGRIFVGSLSEKRKVEWGGGAFLDANFVFQEAPRFRLFVVIASSEVFRLACCICRFLPPK